MKKIVTYILFLIVILLGVTFAYINAEPVVVNYYIANKTLPLSLLLVITLVIGCFLGLLASLCMHCKQKRTINQLRKRANLAEKELANLRTMPLKDNR